MTKYYCKKCERFHLKGKVFQEHKEFNTNLSKSEIWLLQFRKSCNTYKVDSHKVSYGSKKQ